MRLCVVLLFASALQDATSRGVQKHKRDIGDQNERPAMLEELRQSVTQEVTDQLDGLSMRTLFLVESPQMVYQFNQLALFAPDDHKHDWFRGSLLQVSNSMSAAFQLAHSSMFTTDQALGVLPPMLINTIKRTSKLTDKKEIERYYTRINRQMFEASAICAKLAYNTTKAFERVFNKIEPFMTTLREHAQQHYLQRSQANLNEGDIVNLNEGIALMHKAVEYLGQIRDQWLEFAEYFDAMKAVIEQKIVGPALEALIENNEELAEDHIIEEIHLRTALRFVGHCIKMQNAAKIYIAVSKKYIMPNLRKEMVGLTNSERKDRLEQLRNDWNSDEVMGLVFSEKVRLDDRYAKLMKAYGQLLAASVNLEY